MRATIDERAILRQAAELSARESIERFRHGQEALEETLNDCLYHADRRARERPLDSDESRVFGHVRHAVQGRSEHALIAATNELCEHYAREIGGHFDPRVYAIAEKALPRALSLLLSASSLSNLLTHGLGQEELSQRVILSGQANVLKGLMELGTVIVTPTHGSHMDSPVMAYALNQLHMPPFVYGAGKNLFSHKMLGFFMQNLGAYKVDRLKDEALYKRTLKSYCVTTLRHGLPNLFFPGGTRSRSGAIESELKLGLLGCGLEAFVLNLIDKKPKPRVFIVPATISYNLVLEAETLIEDYLKDEGKSRYIIEDDEFSRPERVLNFISSLLRMNGQIHVRFGAPLDPFGNAVNEHGESIDPHGRVVEPEYYVHDQHGAPVLDDARDRQYTRELGQAITKSLRANNTILPTHVLSFALMQLLSERERGRDLYRFLRAPHLKERIPIAQILPLLDKVLGEVRALHAAGQLHACDELAADAETVLARAQNALSHYHLPRAVERHGHELVIGDAPLVYFYHNRLAGYGIGSCSWLAPRARKGNRR